MKQLLGILAGGCAEPRLLSQGTEVSEVALSYAPHPTAVTCWGLPLAGTGCPGPGKVVRVSYFILKQ